MTLLWCTALAVAALAFGGASIDKFNAGDNLAGTVLLVVSTICWLLSIRGFIKEMFYRL